VSARRLVVTGLAGGLAVASGLLAACAPGAARPHTGAVAASPAFAGAPWEIPPSALGTQRLYRAAYAGPEGDGSFRATLRLLTAERFDLRVVDRLGRALWTLRVEGADGWWLDHRRDVACRDLALLELPGLGDGPVDARGLPPLLLGRLPAAGEAAPAAVAGELELRDAQGRRWSVALAEGQPDRWALWDAEGPVWWWSRDGRGGVLSGREGRQLRWQEAVVEPLGGLPAAAPPPGVREDCGPPSPPAA
jgi:hypothetical protein